MSKRAIWSIGILAWLVVLAAATLVDRTVAEWVKARAADTVHSPWHVLFNKSSFLMVTLKLPGYFYFTMVLAVILWALHPRHVEALALVLLSGTLGGLLYCVVKWLVGRHRPVNGIEPFHFTPLAGGLKGLFISPPNLSFPSGHATLSFATAASLAILIPRWRWAFFLAASLVAIERVLENAHYVSDVVAGAGLGVISAGLVQMWLKSMSARAQEVGASATPPNVAG
jgi:membrane-associated phospholipid phosphatase